MLLNTDGQLEFLKSNFHQYFDIELQTDIQETNTIQFVNFVLKLDDINELYDLSKINKFFNEDHTNVIFTSDDNQHIFKYEFYQDVFFIRIEPFSKNIRLHIIPRKYDASSTKTDYPLLIFKDNKQTIDNNVLSHTSQYKRDEEGYPINLYYDAETYQSSNGIYKFNIKNKTKNFKNLQINMGYSYNEHNPQNPIKIKHYTGVLDTSDESGQSVSTWTEFNDTLIDANLDGYDEAPLQDNTRTTDTVLQVNPDLNIRHRYDVGLINPHSIDTLYHKTIKYFNDDIYVEENKKYMNVDWQEIRG